MVAVASTMLATVTLTGLDAVAAATFVTLKVTIPGTVTSACSLTSAVSVVDDAGEPGRVTVSCAEASPAVMAVSATIMDARTNVFFTLSPWGLLEPRLFRATTHRKGQAI